jgi:mycothiol synthase
VITYSWRTVLDAGEERELRQLLAEAAEEDAEAGFPQVSLDQPYGDDAAHLIVRLLPDDRTGDHLRPAAYLRLEPDPGGGPATARYVVRPEFRSRGISTLLLETIGLDLRADDGWAGTGVRAMRIWARGDHPAAQRMACRFKEYGVRPARREWQLLAPLRTQGQDQAGPVHAPVRVSTGAAEMRQLWRRHRQDEPPAKPTVMITGGAADPAGAAWVDPHVTERTQYGTAGRIRAVLVDEAAGNGAEIRRALLTAAMDCLEDHGLRVAAITVDAWDRGLARSCRLLGFMHDRTDTEYTIDSAPGHGNLSLT